MLGVLRVRDDLFFSLGNGASDLATPCDDLLLKQRWQDDRPGSRGLYRYSRLIVQRQRTGADDHGRREIKAAKIAVQVKRHDEIPLEKSTDGTASGFLHGG